MLSPPSPLCRPRYNWLAKTANLEICTLDGCAPCFTAILDTHGCNCRILATPPYQHTPFWLPSSQCSHPPADGCDGCVPAIRPAA